MSRRISTVSVRPAVAADLDAIIDDVWAVAAEGRWIGTEVPFDRDKRRAVFRSAIDSDRAAVFVADDAGRVVGHILVNLASYGVADIGMAIVDGYRGQGIGTALLESAIGWARQARAHKMYLEVWPHNDAGIALYRKLGFTEEGRKRRHYRRTNGELWDAILMGLPL
jgi:ribosomal protein S18 acetylase RimI-like enzyme